MIHLQEENGAEMMTNMLVVIMQGMRMGKMGSLVNQEYDQCGDEGGDGSAYHDSFIDGFISMKGNSRNVCESATDE